MNRRTFAKSLTLSLAPLSLSNALIFGQQSSAAQQTDPASWQRYTVRGEEFSITMPTVPAMATNWDYQAQIKVRRRRTLGAYADGLVYMLQSVEKKQGPLEEYIKREVSKSDWDHNTAKDVACGGFNGKQFNLVSEVGGVLQVFVTENHSYRIQVFGTTAEDSRLKYYFSSLTLGKNQNGIEVSDGEGILLGPSTPTGIIAPEGVETLFIGKDVTRKAILVMRPEPAYTEEARQKGITGTVVLKAVFRSSGEVNNIRTVSELSGGLTEQALQAARKIKFIPAIKNGKFVSMWYQLEYNFNLY